MNKIPQHLHTEDNAGGIGSADNSIATVSLNSLNKPQ